MPLVTKISPQAKCKGYYSVFIDDKFSLSLSELELSSNGLKVGQDLSESELHRLKQIYKNSKCYNCAVRYLALRPRSISEVRQYLTSRKGFNEDQADSAITRLVNEGYLNDLEFARLWVRNRMLLSPKSQRVLWAELMKKGIGKDDIETVLSELSEDDQLGSLIDIIRKKSRLPKYSDKQKMIEFLSRKGYSYDLIKKALDDSADF